MTSEWHQPYSERWAHSPHSASRSALWHAAFPGFQGAQSTDWHSGPFCRLPCIWPCERGIRPKWDSHLGFFVFGVELGETSLDTDPAERGASKRGMFAANIIVRVWSSEVSTWKQQLLLWDPQRSPDRGSRTSLSISICSLANWVSKVSGIEW